MEVLFAGIVVWMVFLSYCVRGLRERENNKEQLSRERVEKILRDTHVKYIFQLSDGVDKELKYLDEKIRDMSRTLSHIAYHEVQHQLVSNKEFHLKLIEQLNKYQIKGDN